MQEKTDFFSIYQHDFIRAAVCRPAVKVADPAYNAERIVELARQASNSKATLALFPELGVSAYSCGDLFHQEALLEAVLRALAGIIEASLQLTPLLLIGAPLRFHGRLYNCALAIHDGRILGVTPKTHLPNFREFDERRHFTSDAEILGGEVTLLGQTVPFGNDIIYECSTLPDLRIHAEIGADLWAPVPPSTYAALAGATVLCNLDAGSADIGKDRHQRTLCEAQSSKTIAAYLQSAAGFGESTNDLAWDGQALIYEKGKLLAESERFSLNEQMLLTDIDLGRLTQERIRQTGFSDYASTGQSPLQTMRRVSFALDVPQGADTLLRRLERFPYVPADPATRDARCHEAFNIQVHGLMKRIRATGIKRIVIGVSGGLDSTHALLVAAQTLDRLKLPRSNILAYTMPGFATSSHTLQNAHALMQALGVSAEEIDIRPSCMQMLKDIGHPYADGQPVYDVTFENVQAGERTSHLFRLANQHHGLVLGTGDLSEGALGWSTYGVGDHMSHYNVNASVPKTLIQYLIRWVAETQQMDAATSAILQAVVETEISPELVPGAGDEEASQSTESQIGPYELQDFNIYYTTRYGFRPSKVAFLAYQAWHDRSRGDWPSHIIDTARNEYQLADIKKWLKLFIYRFFKISQFKRTAVPNGPKISSGSSLSPRGDWRAPSDSEIIPWLDELERNVPDV